MLQPTASLAIGINRRRAAGEKKRGDVGTAGQSLFIYSHGSHGLLALVDIVERHPGQGQQLLSEATT